MKIQQASIKVICAAMLLAHTVVRGQQPTPTPAPAQTGSILILNATAHLGNGRVIARSAVGFDKGKITFVGEASEADREGFSMVVDAAGKHVYPSLIAANTQLGLVEIEAVRATRDFAEVGSFNASARALIAFNTDSRIIPTVRSNGVLLAQVVPVGGRISGRSSVMALDGWNWEDAVLAADEGVWMDFPTLHSYSGWWAEPGDLERNKEYEEQVRVLGEYFAAAKAYAAAPASGGVKNLNFEAMRGLFEGRQRLFIRTNDAKTMMEAVLFAEAFGVKYALVGAADAWRITDFLKAHETALILDETQRLPTRTDEAVDLPFAMPAVLERAGIFFCLSMPQSWQVRNLAFQAGQAVGYGLEKEAALQAITLNVAKLLGIEERVGSIEVGKDATLFISKGDALDPLTQAVEMAFINGRQIDLNNKQKSLAKQYETRYGQ